MLHHLAGVAALLTASLAAQQVVISHQVVSSWSTGFSGRVTIHNQAPWTIFDWRLDFDANYQITGIWNAQVVGSTGGRYGLQAIVASWEDGDLSPNEQVVIDFNANGAPALPTNATLNGSPVVMNGPSPAPGPLQARPAPPWPDQVFAPYVDAVAWPLYDLVGVATAQGLRFFNLAFVVARGANDPTPSWGGYYDVTSQFRLPEIDALRNLGGDVMVSFGGASGTEMAVAATSVAQLTAAYQTVIDTYGLTHVDFDIEGAWVAHPASIQRRSQALAALQANARAAGRELRIWLTLPVLPQGLTQDGRNVVASALQAGVDLDGVNVMAMDYGGSAAPNPAGNMGNYAIAAVQNTHTQLAQLYQSAGQPQPPAVLWRKLGVTPMIGVNDVSTEVFVQADMQQVRTFASQQGLGMLSFWSMLRDRQCAGGAMPYASYDCSSILQQPFEFTGLGLPFTIATWRNLGGSLPGTGGAPQLAGNGALLGGSPWSLQLGTVAPSAPCLFVLGLSSISQPLLGGVLVPTSDWVVFTVATANGTTSLSATWPTLALRRLPFWSQALVLDPTATGGVAFSNALLAYTP
jgi:hypothetical protein